MKATLLLLALTFSHLASAALPATFGEIKTRTSLQMQSLGSAPANPGSGVLKLYEKSNVLYKLDSSGSEKAVAADGQTPNFLGLGVLGSSSGTISILGQAAAGTYNFNLPITAGSSGQVLTSGGGAGAPMTWGSPLTNPMTTSGDVIIGGASGAATRAASVPITSGGTGQVTKAAGFDALSPMTTKGDIPVFSTLGIRLAVGTDGQYLRADSSQASGLAWGHLTVVAPTTTYSVLSTDDIVAGNATSAAFTATLPTAVGRSGKVYRIKKTDSSINAITIATTSSQTIDGVTTATLSTQYESMTLASDGANWQILERRIPSVWVSYTPTSSWTSGATITGQWRRVGDSVEIRVRADLTAGPTAVGLTFTLPSGLTANASKFPNSNSNAFTYVGGAYDTSANIAFPLTAYLASTTTLSAYSNNASQVTASSPVVFAIGDFVILHAVIPIVGWGG